MDSSLLYLSGYLAHAKFEADKAMGIMLPSSRVRELLSYCLTHYRENGLLFIQATNYRFIIAGAKARIAQLKVLYQNNEIDGTEMLSSILACEKQASAALSRLENL